MVRALGSFIPTNAWVRAALAPVLIFIATAINRNYLADFWHHLARGRAIATEGRLLDEDRFTYTVRGQPFQDVNWLSQLAFYHLHRLGGLDLLQAVNALVLAGSQIVAIGPLASTPRPTSAQASTRSHCARIQVTMSIRASLR